MTSITSDKFNIYPASNRAYNSDFKARLNIEENIIKTNNNITNYNSYVVNGLELSKDSNNKLIISNGKCVINGYSIDILESITTNIAVSNNAQYLELYLTPLTKTVTMNNLSQNITELILSDLQGTFTDNFTGNGSVTDFILSYPKTSITSSSITVKVDNQTVNNYTKDETGSIIKIIFSAAPSNNSKIAITYNLTSTAYGFGYNCVNTEGALTNDKWHLTLATNIRLDNSELKCDYNQRNARINANSTRIDTTNFTGLLQTPGASMYLEQFLEDLVIDDGDIN